MNRRASLAVPLLLALILVPLQVRQHLATSSFWRCDRQDPYDDQAGCYPSLSEELIAGARFARDSLEAGAAVATYRTATVAWFSGHRTARLSSLMRPDRPKAYGLANLEEKRKAAPKTNYRLASVTKQFTAPPS